MKRAFVGMSTLLVLAVLAWRIIAMSVGQVKTGETKTSPDQRFEASVMESYGETFWGQKKHWLEFRLQGQGIDKFLKTDYIEGPYFGSRSTHSVIEWSDDSSIVRFVFPDTELIFLTGQE